MKASGLARLVYLLMLTWILIWMAFLPPPAGRGMGGWAILACLPLAFPLVGVVRLQTRSVIWAAYLVLLYLMFGIMEFWTVPAQRGAASLFIVLCLLFLLSAGFATRRRRN